MSDSPVTGKVEHVNDQEGKNYYGVKVGDTWYNGNGSTDLSEGDNVRIELRDEFLEDPEDEFIAVNNVEVVGSGSDQSGEAEVSSDSDARRMGEGAATDNFHLSKQDNIRLQVAFKKAVDTVNHEEGLMDESLNRGERIEAVSSYTNGYFNLLEAQAKDKSENGGEE